MHFAWQAQYKRHLHQSCYRRSGADFLRRVAFWSIRSSGLFAEMILRDGCSTSYDLASLFRGRGSTLDRWTGKMAKCIGTRLSALHSPCLKKVSQNCFVFDVVKFKNWRRLAELLRFWCCQHRKIRKSRRRASFLMLSTSKNEEVSQNSFVFNLADRQKDGQTDRQTERER